MSIFELKLYSLTVAQRGMQMNEQGKTVRKRKTLRIVIICLSALIVLGIVLRILLSPMIVYIANRQLPKYFASEAKLKEVHLEILGGRATIRGLTIKQPKGYGDDLLIDLPEIKVKVNVWSLFASTLTVDEIIVTELKLHLVRDKDGKMNVANILPPAEERKPEPSEAPKAVRIKKISVRNSSVQYSDSALGKELFDVKAGKVDSDFTNIYLNCVHPQKQTLPGKAELTAHVMQHGFSDALLGIIVRFGYIGPEEPVPALNGAIRLGGLELQTLHAVAAQELPQAIGGDIMDFYADISMAADIMDCKIGIITPTSNTISMNIGGTPYDPLVDRNNFPYILGNRAGEAGFNILKDAAKAGEEIGSASLSSLKALAEGGEKMFKRIGTSIYNASASVSQGNIAEAGDNLAQSASGPVSDSAKETFDKTGASLSEGVGKAGNAFAGTERSKAWRADVLRRWTASWEAACKSVQEKPFPQPALKTAP